MLQNDFFLALCWNCETQVSVNAETPVLVVDLDETLLRTDLLLFQVVLGFRHRPLTTLKRILSIPWTGVVALKEKMARDVYVDPNTLHFRDEVLKKVKKHREQGGKTALASASHHLLVEKIARELNVFDYVIGSRNENLKGKRKTQALKQVLGDKPFIYIGDASVDLFVWREAAKIVAVNPSSILRYRLARLKKPFEVISDHPHPLRVLWSSLRVPRWSQNVLIFWPLINQAESQFSSFLIGFATFSLWSSALYLIDDYLNLEVARRQSLSDQLPLAFGSLSLRMGVVLTLVCMVSAFLLALKFLPLAFLFVTGVYTLFKMSAALGLRHLLGFDIIIMSFLMTLRVFLGESLAEEFMPAHFPLLTLLFFFGDSLCMRANDRSSHAYQREYQLSDTPILQILGISSLLASGVLACLVLVNGPWSTWIATITLIVYLHWILRSLTNAQRKNTGSPLLHTYQISSLTVFILLMGLLLIPIS